VQMAMPTCGCFVGALWLPFTGVSLSTGLGTLAAFGSFLCFPRMHPSGQALSMQSVVVWLRGHPEPG
jgi:hypothetical protein